jgi:WD40 repeat protein
MRKLFYRIDANGDGTVDWDEFSLYMLLENQGCAAIREAEQTRLLVEPRESGINQRGHKKIIQCCSSLPPCGGSSYRIATGGRDGAVILWDSKVH